MLIIHRLLDLSVHNHLMLWAACCLGFFGFLSAGEFTFNAPFDPVIHLSVNNIQADSLFNPQSLRILIKWSRLTPFVKAVTSTLVLVGKTSALCVL